MSCKSNTPNIEKTFIIETTNGEVLSACTMLHVNNIATCGTGETITILNDVITPSLNANILYSGGTNLIDIFGGANVVITGFTYNDANLLTIETNVGGNFSVLIDEMANLTINGVLSADTFAGGVQTISESGITTTDASQSVLDIITGIPSDETRFVESYITAHNDLNDYGFWKRTLGVVNISGDTSIILENADTDIYSSGLTAVNISYSATGADILVQVVGETAKAYNWISDWNIIKKS